MESHWKYYSGQRWKAFAFPFWLLLWTLLIHNKMHSGQEELLTVGNVTTNIHIFNLFTQSVIVVVFVSTLCISVSGVLHFWKLPPHCSHITLSPFLHVSTVSRLAHMWLYSYLHLINVLILTWSIPLTAVHGRIWDLACYAGKKSQQTLILWTI